MYNIIYWFMKTYPEIVQEMKNSEHNYDINNPNPYHLEDVWTHTMMVCNHAAINSDDIYVWLGALLHDIGKPRSRMIDEEKKRAAFYNHENISTYMAIDVLNQFKIDFKEYKDLEIDRVLKLINWHSDLHKIGIINELGDFILSNKDKEFLDKKYNDKMFYKQQIELNMADNSGRFGLNKDYQVSKERIENLKLYKPKKIINQSIEEKPELIMLIGIAGSGKSEIRKILLKNKKYIVLSTDDIIQSMYPDKNYNEAFKLATKDDGWNKIEKIFNQNLINSIKNKENIILDQQNLSKKSRRSKLNNFKKGNYNINAIVVLTGEKNHRTLLKKRAEKENKTISYSIIEQGIKNLFLPGNDEFDNVYIIINENISNISELQNKFENIFYNKTKNLEFIKELK